MKENMGYQMTTTWLKPYQEPNINLLAFILGFTTVILFLIPTIVVLNLMLMVEKQIIPFLVNLYGKLSQKGRK